MTDTGALKLKVSVVGLGYVGLPLAIAFSEKYHTVGFDINDTRVCELKSGIDRTQEVSSSIIKSSKNIKFTCQIDDLDGCDVFVITVPTPVDQANQPDLSNLIAASELVASKIRTGGIVVFESTVFPGATEEILAPIIQKISGLEYNNQFFCGYSPEKDQPWR